ncbi:hypothetical protein LR69_04486 [Geobacillus sp. BCO2]|nr:hypothetical protein LR69_04486 [Geobacillus sp. BCO2]
MKNNKTIKRDFYLLVVKVVLATAITSAFTYLCIIYLIMTLTTNHVVKPTNYFVKDLDGLRNKVKENERGYFQGETHSHPSLQRKDKRRSCRHQRQASVWRSRNCRRSSGYEQSDQP